MNRIAPLERSALVTLSSTDGPFFWALVSDQRKVGIGFSTVPALARSNRDYPKFLIASHPRSQESL